jgi:hypothetical protein
VNFYQASRYTLGAGSGLAAFVPAPATLALEELLLDRLITLQQLFARKMVAEAR